MLSLPELALIFLFHSCYFTNSAAICTGDLQLVGGIVANEGRVEVCKNGEWGTVCGASWSQADAVVVCRQLGYLTQNASAILATSSGSGGIFLTDVRCTGLEDTLLSCTHSNDTSSCLHSMDVGVNCYVCAHGDVRLRGSTAPNVGRVEICFEGQWGTVCADNLFGTVEALVVCRQLGYLTGGRTTSVGPGTGPIVLGNLLCSGSEPSLLDCATIGPPSCSHASDASIGCGGNTCSAGSARLVGGSSAAEGRVEVCSAGRYWTICGEGWDDEDAAVICRQLRYSSFTARAVPGDVFGAGGFPILFYNVNCISSRHSSIIACPTSTSGSCAPYQTASVSCTNVPVITDIRPAKNSVTIKWSYPRTAESGTIKFLIRLVYVSGPCGSVQSVFVDSNVTDVTTRKHTVDGLLAASTYTVKVVANLQTETDQSFATKAETLQDNVIAPGVYVSIGSITIIWNAAACASDILHYVIVINIEDSITYNGTDGRYVLTDLASGCYNIRLYPVLISNTNGNDILLTVGCVVQGVPTTTAPEDGTSTEDATDAAANGTATTDRITGTNGPSSVSPLSLTEIAVIVVGGVALISILCICCTIVVCVKRRKKKKKKAKRMSKIDTRAPFKKDDNLPLLRRPGSRNEYVLSMQDNSLRELLIPFKSLRLLNVIGEGEFGMVYKAVYVEKDVTKRGSRISRNDSRISHRDFFVAVKVQKEVDGNEDEILNECKFMKDFDHPNVLPILGLCMDGGATPYVVMPFMSHGSLKSYMKENGSKLMISPDDTDEDTISTARKRLLDMINQIAKGMEYLAQNSVIHRDLAARNCMIDDSWVIKVADFGLSKNAGTKDYFRQDEASGAKLPVKWMALESLQEGVFSEKTDVWSYGVTAWEVFSIGKSPYKDKHPVAVIELLRNGGRLEIPENRACDDTIFSIMQDCWLEDPKERPNFGQIHQRIAQLIESMSDYMEVMAFGAFK